MRWPRLSIRTRLAIGLAGGLCLMAVLVIAISYVLVDRSLTPGTGRPSQVIFTGSLPDQTFVRKPQGAQVARRNPVPLSPQQRRQLNLVASRIRTDTMKSLVITWAEIALPLVLASALLAWLLATFLLRPLRGITGAARRLSAASLDQRIALAGPRDELRELADTFDDMLGRLDAAFAGQRRFVANASHELRTPLAIMRAQIDVATGDANVTRAELLATAGVVGTAVDRCERLLDGLLTLARTDRLQAVEPVDLAALAAAAVRGAAARARAGGVEVRTELRPARVCGEPALLERLVGNLLENAIAYNHRGGTVDVSVAVVSGALLLRVINSGPPVPAEAVEALFEPFRRLDPDRTGSAAGAGLGLSIVRAVARAHGGDASAGARSEGGLEVEVRMPAAAGATGETPPGPLTAAVPETVAGPSGVE